MHNDAAQAIGEIRAKHFVAVKFFLLFLRGL
jgi:hypothetical protein